MAPRQSASAQQEITPAGMLAGAALVVVVGLVYRGLLFHKIGMSLQAPRKGRRAKR